MRRTLCRAQGVAGVVWALSWFELYLEVYRFRHVAPPASLAVGAPPLAVGDGARAGGWPRAVLAGAAFAPRLCAARAAVPGRPAEPRFRATRALGRHTRRRT